MFFQGFVKQDRKDELKDLFGLIKDSLVEGDETHKFFEELVVEKGLAALRDLAQASKDNQVDPGAYINAIIGVYVHFSQMISQALGNDKWFATAMDLACVRFVNKNDVTGGSSNASKGSELLARYCDSLLKKTSTDTEDDKLEEALCNVVCCFLSVFAFQSHRCRLEHDARKSGYT